MKRHHWIALFLVALLAWPLWAGFQQVTSCAKSRQYAAIKEDIRDQLKAPASAKFSGTSQTTWTPEKVGRCAHRVAGFVDAENDFGAVVRHEFEAIVLVEKSQPTVMWANLRSR